MCDIKLGYDDVMRTVNDLNNEIHNLRTTERTELRDPWVSFGDFAVHI